MNKSKILPAILMAFFMLSARAAELHVAKTGEDSNPGTSESPFLTIQRAADAARPGDVITVHEGVYRERVNPPRGGESETKRIVYQAAPGEEVTIKGSEVVTGWEKHVEGRGAQQPVWRIQSVYEVYHRQLVQ